jgi:hypothetical protein
VFIYYYIVSCVVHSTEKSENSKEDAGSKAGRKGRGRAMSMQICEGISFLITDVCTNQNAWVGN